MFADDVQVLYASGSDCKIHPGAGPVDESFRQSTAAGDVIGTAGGDLLSSEEHYKKNYNSLKILVAMCRGLKNEDDSDIVV